MDATNDYELFAVCARCGREITLSAESEAEAIRTMRNSGWAYDASPIGHHLCGDCLDEVVLRPGQGLK